MSLQKWKARKEKAQEEGNLADLFSACSKLAEIYCSKEEFENAIKEYKVACRAAEAEKNVIDIALANRMIGEMYCNLQDFDPAIQHVNKYLDLVRSNENLVEEQRALATLGHLYLLKADMFANPNSKEKQDCLFKAKRFCLQSLQVCQGLHVSKFQLTEMEARLHLNLGLILDLQNDTNQAIEHFHKAIMLCKGNDIWEFLYRSYNALGSLYKHEDNSQKALENFEKALSVAQRLPDKIELICEVLLLKADVLFDLPDFRGAKQSLLKAYKLKTKNSAEVEERLRVVAAVSRFEETLLKTPTDDLVTLKQLYESLGDGCAKMKSYTKALEYYHLMLQTAEKMGESGEQLRSCFVSLSQTYKDNKQYSLALKYFEEELALSINNPLEACKTTMNIAEVLEIKEAGVEEILTRFEQARNFARAANDYKLEARSLSAMIQVLKDGNRLTGARKLEAELENLKEKFGPFPPSSESEEEENTPDIGADICLDDLSDNEPDNDINSKASTRRRNPTVKFKINEKGEYPLHTACIQGNLNLVKKLIEQGHPVNVRDHSGWSPLHEACNHGHLEIVKELLDHKAMINDKGAKDCEGLTPLLDAATCGNLDVMELLLERGASPVMRTNRGDTVLDCLKDWRKRNKQDMKQDLDGRILDQFNNLVEVLKTALIKAGHKLETENRVDSGSPSPVSSTQHESRKRQSRNESFRDNHKRRPGLSVTCTDSWRGNAEEILVRKNSSDREKTSKSCSNSLRRSIDEIPTYESTNATREYEDAMKALRRKPLALPTSQSPPPESKSALLPEEEMVNDWLIDDIGPTRGVKRRRPHQFDREPLRRQSRLTSPEQPRQRHTFRSISPVNNHSTDSADTVENHPRVTEDENRALLEMTELLSNEDRSFQERNQPYQNVATSTSVFSNSFQAPLSAFGVTNRPSIPLQEPTTVFSVAAPASQPVAMHHTQLATPSQVAPPSIKVRVEGKLLLIPLPTNSDGSQTIAWLVEEAAKRYYSFVGVEPKLTLQTEDGAMLGPQDPVTLLLGYREVAGIVTAWKQHPITERYQQACSELGQDPDDYLERCLDTSQGSFSLNLQGCSLSAIGIDPVFRVAAHQAVLQHLILCDNRLGDTGMQLLAELVPKLPHLRELDLTCNGISEEGFNIFIQHVVEHQACKRLETLKLCHNRLGKSCVNLLSKLLQVTSSLKSLSLKSVGITGASFSGAPQLLLGRVERLDVSYNLLGGDGACALLRDWPVTAAVTAGLANTGQGVGGEVATWLARGNPCQLQALSISHCTDGEHTLAEIVRNLERAPLLEQLELSGERLSDASLQALYRLPLRVLRLPGVRVTFPPTAAPPPIEEFTCLSLCGPSHTVPPWAATGPFGLLTNNTCPSAS